jgi:hypothetical protein
MSLVLAAISTAKGRFNEGFGLEGGDMKIKRTRWTEPNWVFIHMAMANGTFKKALSCCYEKCMFLL